MEALKIDDNMSARDFMHNLAASMGKQPADVERFIVM